MQSWTIIAASVRFLDFTDDDWQAAEENGFSRSDVIALCEDSESE